MGVRSGVISNLFRCVVLKKNVEGPVEGPVYLLLFYTSPIFNPLEFVKLEWLKHIVMQKSACLMCIYATWPCTIADMLDT